MATNTQARVAALSEAENALVEAENLVVTNFSGAPAFDWCFARPMKSAARWWTRLPGSPCRSAAFARSIFKRAALMTATAGQAPA